MIFNAKSNNFCDDLNSEVSISYDYNGDKYNCFRLWGEKKYRLLKEDKISPLIICENNKKSSNICQNCWAKNFCKICIVSILQGEDALAFNDGKCIDEKAYKICMEELLKIISGGKLEQLSTNFSNNFTDYD